MAAAPDLLNVYKRILTRIETGTKQFTNLNRIMIKRAEVYEKTTKLLQELFTLEIDSTDLLEATIMDEIKKEAKMHETMAEQIKLQILDPAKDVMSTLGASKKSLDRMLSKQIKELDKATKQVEQSYNDLEEEKKKRNATKGPKREQADKKVMKQDQYYHQKLDNANMVAVESQSKEMPIIHKDFMCFDSDRMTAMQRYCVSYIDLKKKMSAALEEQHQKLYNQYMSYDAKDRSTRYTTRCFDPKTNDAPENEEVYAIAIADYRSEQATDLTFQRGDKIKVLLQHSSGWWDGEFNGKKGTFPKTFVQLPQMHESTTIQVGAYFTVDSDYKPKLNSEMEIVAGDMVYVEYIKNGKANGKNLRSGKLGNFPSSLLKDQI